MKLALLSMALLFLLGIANIVLAGSCSLDAYKKACANCQFDSNGKIDQSCMAAYKSSGIACVSSSYPLLSARYSAGKCPEVDICASNLQKCISETASGNDKKDCMEGSMSYCYSDADICIEKAAIHCDEKLSSCFGSISLIVLAVLGTLGMAAAKSRI